MLAEGVPPVTIGFTEQSSSNGGEPIELMKALAFEYLAELNRMGLVEFIESVGKEGQAVLIAIIPNVKVQDGKIMEANARVGATNPLELSVGKPEGEPDAVPISN